MTRKPVTLLVAPIALALLFGVLSSSALAGTRAVKPLKLVYREHQTAVAPGSTGVVLDRCPATAPHGISGYFEAANPPGAFLLAFSAPTRQGWADGALNSGATTASFLGGEVCSSRRFAETTSQLVLNPGQAAGYTERCPQRDPKPINGVEFPASGTPGDVIVAESFPFHHAWITVLKNLGTGPETYVIGVFCAPRSRHVVLLTTGVDTIAAHQIDMPTARCPREAPDAIGGSFFPARNTALGDIALATSTPLVSTHRVWGIMVKNLTSQRQNDVIGTVCLG
jgi:hypothetical protein